MQNDNIPNPNIINPIQNLENMIYVKPTIKNPNIIVGDYTYFADVDFEAHVTHHYEQEIPPLSKMPLKGDTIVGNDVWIGQNVTILPGVHIGDGVIIGLNSVISKNVEPYTIVAGNPAKVIRKRFDDELIEIMEKLKKKLKA